MFFQKVFRLFHLHESIKEMFLGKPEPKIVKRDYNLRVEMALLIDRLYARKDLSEVHAPLIFSNLERFDHHRTIQALTLLHEKH